MWFIYCFNFERSYDVLKSKSPCILLKKNINFNQFKTESKMGNPTHSFREKNLVPQPIEESQIKSKTVMSYSLRKKKRHFLYRLFCLKATFLKIYVLSQCIVYWIHFQNIHTFTFCISVEFYHFFLRFEVFLPFFILLSIIVLF